MSSVLSSATAEEFQLVCRVNTLPSRSCNPECPLRCICGEQVRDWPIQDADVGFKNPYGWTEEGL